MRHGCGGIDGHWEVGIDRRDRLLNVVTTIAPENVVGGVAFLKIRRSSQNASVLLGRRFSNEGAIIAL